MPHRRIVVPLQVVLVFGVALAAITDLGYPIPLLHFIGVSALSWLVIAISYLAFVVFDESRLELFFHASDLRTREPFVPGVTHSWIGRFAIGVLWAFVVVVYVIVFSWTVFPAMPEQVGGVRPRTVRLLFRSDAAPELAQIGLDVSDTRLLSPALSLIWEGDEAYVVRRTDKDAEMVLRIDKDLVGAVSILADVPSILSPASSTPAADH